MIQAKRENGNEELSMKLRSALCCMMALGFCTSSAYALAPLSKYLEETYKEDKDYKAFFTTVDGLKSKCDVCHIPGANKKKEGHGLNDFGKAYHNKFDLKAFQPAQKEKKTEEATKLFKDAWEKAIQEKNGDGAVFADLIKEGKNPGKNN